MWSSSEAVPSRVEDNKPSFSSSSWDRSGKETVPGHLVPTGCCTIKCDVSNCGLQEVKKLGTSLEAQWLRISAPNAGGLGSILDQETRSQMPQLTLHIVLQLKDPASHNEDQRSPRPQLRPSKAKINKYYSKTCVSPIAGNFASGSSQESPNNNKVLLYKGLPWWLSSKESKCNARKPRDTGSIPRSGRSPGGGNGNPLQCSCLENPMDRRIW